MLHRAHTRHRYHGWASLMVGVAVLLAALTGCSPGPSESALPAGPPSLTVARTPASPTLGGCHQTDWAAFMAETAVTTEVDCSVPHTAKTVYVGHYPDALAAKAKRYDDPPIARWVVPRCSALVASYLGTDRATMSRSLFSQTTYFASQAQFTHGEHSFRCDVALAEFAAKRLLPLPQRVRNALAKTMPTAYVGCLDQPGSARIMANPPTVSCTEPHNARPVGSIRLGGPLDPYPSVTAIRTQAVAGCVSMGRQWVRRTHSTATGVRYRAPTRRGWESLLDRSAECYVMTTS